jgi:Tfp pilus assembly protein PilO
MLIALMIIAILVILVLAGYAVYLTGQVSKQKKLTAELKQKREAAEQQKRDYIHESLRVISTAALNAELTSSEAVIRCKMLLDGLVLTEDEWLPYRVLREVFDKVCEFDTHQARQALSKEERRKQDAAREAIEHDYQDALTQCFKELVSIS